MWKNFQHLCAVSTIIIKKASVYIEKMNLGILYMLYLSAFFVSCSDIFTYEKIRRIVNEADDCSLDDVDYIDRYSTKLYWIWTNSFFRYLRIKTYIYENDEIYESIKNVNNKILEIFKDNIFSSKNKDEFIRNALTILSNEKTLKKSIDLYVPKNTVKFFQEISEQQLIHLFIEEKKNLINSFNKLKMFDKFRDVANSKYYYHKKLLENRWEPKIDDTEVSDKKEKNNYNTQSDNVKYKRVKNVITFNFEDIPHIKQVYFDYYDKNKWNKYFYFNSDEEKVDIDQMLDVFSKEIKTY
ncbi:conserved Plasmodium protein, unknown function [Plasmodium ovale curtisi]|uniref:Uncharacterized protein n=1 Tax=Plasmodium ovale curtisi TaxID=864141 RepID=A0A1A8WNE0_PLAOA|nr:conserved Plasmodium protein, unknown function [Plasmodium ovale curtisi]